MVNARFIRLGRGRAHASGATLRIVPPDPAYAVDAAVDEISALTVERDRLRAELEQLRSEAPAIQQTDVAAGAEARTPDLVRHKGRWEAILRGDAIVRIVLLDERDALRAELAAIQTEP